MCLKQLSIYRILTVLLLIIETLILGAFFVPVIIASTANHSKLPRAVLSTLWLSLAVWFLQLLLGWISVSTLRLRLLYVYVVSLIFRLGLIVICLSFRFKWVLFGASLFHLVLLLLCFCLIRQIETQKMMRSTPVIYKLML